MSDPLRVGVVGLAGIGQAHLFAAAALPAYDLVAVCDVAQDAREKVAADFAAEPFADSAEMFAADLDAVVVATPPATHRALVLDALDAGLHVYCEKPLAPTAAIGAEIGRSARSAARVVEVGFQFRFQRSACSAHELVASGAIGDVFRADLTATNWFRTQHYYESAAWRSTWAGAGGGVLMSQAVHQIDALVWLVGLPSRVTARWGRLRHRAEVEDDVAALLEWSNGARGTLVASTTDPVGDDRLAVHGELATVSVEGFRLRHATFGDGTRRAQQLSDEGAHDFEEVPVEWSELVAPAGGSEWFDMVLDCHRDFLAAIRDAHEPRNPPDEATRSLQLINALYLSALRGCPIELPLDAEAYDDAYARLCRGDAEVR